VKAGVICNGGFDQERALKAELEAAAPAFDFHNTTHCWFDVVPHGWSKAQGVEILQREMGLSPDEICVFGDAENDLPLFDVCVHSCAVANATDAVKSRARWHVGASAEDGVAIALEDIADAARRGALPSFFS
jgi:hydroxymethylpyrimidine pyrophosphatase-like HAD family hydrolase